LDLLLLCGFGNFNDFFFNKTDNRNFERRLFLDSFFNMALGYAGFKKPKPVL
jgi:hypothetical protein